MLMLQFEKIKLDNVKERFAEETTSIMLLQIKNSCASLSPITSKVCREALFLTSNNVAPWYFLGARAFYFEIREAQRCYRLVLLSELL